MASGWGDTTPRETDVVMGDATSAAIQQLPRYGEAVREQVMPFEQTRLGATQAMSPEYLALIDQLYSQYGPSLARTGAGIDEISRMGAGAVDARLLEQYGPQLARLEAQLEQQNRPEIASTRQAIGQSIQDLLRSVNLNAPNEEASRLISRENARSGNLAAPSALNTTANALQFGDEQRKRQATLTAAINAANQYLPAAQSGQLNLVQNTLARNPSNTGQNQFLGLTTPGDEAMRLGESTQSAAAAAALQQSKLEQEVAGPLDVFDAVNPDSIS